MYNEILTDHFRYPRHDKQISPVHASSKVVNSSCGDEIEVFFLLEENSLVKDLQVKAVGCVISRATASLLAEKVCGMNLEQVFSITKEDILHLVGIPIGPVRLRCALLSLEAFHKALLPLYQK